MTAEYGRLKSCPTISITVHGREKSIVGNVTFVFDHHFYQTYYISLTFFLQKSNHLTHLVFKWTAMLFKKKVVPDKGIALTVYNGHLGLYGHNYTDNNDIGTGWTRCHSPTG